MFNDENRISRKKGLKRKATNNQSTYLKINADIGQHPGRDLSWDARLLGKDTSLNARTRVTRSPTTGIRPIGKQISVRGECELLSLLLTFRVIR